VGQSPDEQRRIAVSSPYAGAQISKVPHSPAGSTKMQVTDTVPASRGTVSSALGDQVKCKFCDAVSATLAVPYEGACLSCSVARADDEYLQNGDHATISVPNCIRAYVSRQALERIGETNLGEFQTRIEEIVNETTKGTIHSRFFGVINHSHEFWIRVFANDPGEHIVFVATGEEGAEEIVLTI